MINRIVTLFGLPAVLVAKFLEKYFVRRSAIVISKCQSRIIPYAFSPAAAGVREVESGQAFVELSSGSDREAVPSLRGPRLRKALRSAIHLCGRHRT